MVGIGLHGLSSSDPVLAFLSCLFVVIAGLCLGSFATALIYRVPKGISWIREDSRSARSRCPDCGHVLGLKDLIPVFSWVFSRGKCRHCGHPVAAFYPLVELATLAFCLVIYAAWGLTPLSVTILLLIPFLVALTVIDWRHMILPNDLNLAALILAVPYIFLKTVSWNLSGDPWTVDKMMLINHLAAFLLFPLLMFLTGFVMEKILKKEALGMGDVKFMAVMGAWAGLEALPFLLIFSGVLGVLTGLWQKMRGRDGRFPFGPSLILALYIYLFLTGMGFDGMGEIY